MILLNSILSVLLSINMNFANVADNINDSIKIVYGDETTDLFPEELSNPLAVFNNSNDGVYITSADIDLMAKIVYGESVGEPYEGKVAVASVILNRVLSDEFPSTVSGVVKQPGAFSCVINGNIHVTPTKACYNAVHDALLGTDPSQNSLFFYNPDIATCQWMKSVKKNNLIEIGNHIFFVSND